MSRPYRPLKASEPNSEVISVPEPNDTTVVWAVGEGYSLPFKTTKQRVLDDRKYGGEWVEYQAVICEVDPKSQALKTIKELKSLIKEWEEFLAGLE